jgi:membrane fusion protein (multidrug efflux system)
VREGDVVKKGDHLLSIGRKKGADALLASANQDLKNEEAELQRIKQLVDSGAIPKDQLDLARTRHARMVAQLEKMKETSEDYEVRAPWDGVVSKVLVAEGNYVAARTVMVEIFDPDTLVIRTAVPEADSHNIAPDLEVSVSLDAHQGKKFTGKIARVFPELERRSRTRTAEVEIAGNVQLAPGMFARLNMDLEKRHDTLVVPSEAIIVTPKGSRIAFVLENCKTSQRKVETGVEAGGKVEILSGLKPGEKIVVAGNEKLKDGMEVRTNVIRMAKATGEKESGTSETGTDCK